ncbi:hypothetical protein JSY36_02125 [Bacillus sp. H-16]|uniref:hypothetical protein n=1 Tax=Alteribacter salitolerans TaxID=2912333 RepID=UPI0019637128|nr:hypothetical protein [Alteribacter salitolerans]MBM7094540.1 hypothetical protein [Alteribacter salitolerans]
MDFQLQSHDGAFPCEVTCDEDNGRYMIRKADTSGEVFNSSQELKEWIEQNWNEAMFNNRYEYTRMLASLSSSVSE